MLKKMGVQVNGDIGCYTLGASRYAKYRYLRLYGGKPLSIVHGFEKADASNVNKTVAILGDSTFIHSGITPLVNMVHNQGHGTVIILDNSITGMTGHQQNPTTGKTVKGRSDGSGGRSGGAVPFGARRSPNGARR